MFDFSGSENDTLSMTEEVLNNVILFCASMEYYGLSYYPEHSLWKVAYFGRYICVHQIV